jgi:hypothetical protein
MANYVILDTCIYRELGFKFYDNIDYKNIHGFTIATNGEVLLSTIVAAEFENQYTLELRKKVIHYRSSINALERDSYFDFKSEDFYDVTLKIESAKKLFREKLHNDPKHNVPISTLKSIKIDGLELTNFIINSKNEGVSNLQVRDYLIWDSILHFAKKNSKDRTTEIGLRKVTFEKSIVSFITKDNVFSDSSLFIALKSKYGIDNIEILNSIPEYLHKKGYNLPFVTPKLLLKRITAKRFLNDLEKDINALLTYISPKFTNQECESAIAIHKEIQDVELTAPTQKAGFRLRMNIEK